MKNKLFRKAATKATALAIGSLVVFSGQALAFSSNNQEVRNTGVLGNSELLIAQCMSAKCPSEPVEPKDRVALTESIATALTTVGDALAVAQASSLTRGAKDAIARSLAGAATILGNAEAIAQSTALTRGEATAVAQSIAAAQSLIGNAKAIAQSLAVSKEGVSVAQAIARAETSVGDAVAVAQSTAR
jgi:hypothetical protein